jgi:TolB-like protein
VIFEKAVRKRTVKNGSPSVKNANRSQNWRPATEFPSAKFDRDKPAIAMLPFANLSGDPQQQYVGDILPTI